MLTPRLFEQAGTQGDPGAAAAAAPKPGEPQPQPGEPKPGEETPAQKAAREAAAKADGPPEKYEFKAADGHALDSELVGEFSGIAKELGLSQAKAEKLVPLGQKIAQKQQAAYQAFVEKTRSDWVSVVKADQEIGGANLDQNLGLAKKAIAAFDKDGELVKYLNDSGAGDNPALIRAFFRIGKAISEDRLVTGGRSGSAAPDKPPTFSYPNSKMS